MAQGQVRVISYQRNRVVLETENPQAGTLITSEADYPGWKALVDGLEHPIKLFDGAFRSLELPAGRHRIEFLFRPAILWWCGAVSGLALLGVLLCVQRTFQRA